MVDLHAIGLSSNKVNTGAQVSLPVQLKLFGPVGGKNAERVPLVNDPTRFTLFHPMYAGSSILIEVYSPLDKMTLDYLPC